MRESTIEKYLVAQVKKHGGKAYKFVSPGNRGVPDRIVIFPGGSVTFVELKAPGKKLRPEQRVQRQLITQMGCLFATIDSKDHVDIVITELRPL